MSKSKRVRYTLEFKIEAVRLVRGRRIVGAVSQVPGVASQTLHDWVKREAQGQLKGPR